MVERVAELAASLIRHQDILGIAGLANHGEPVAADQGIPELAAKGGIASELQADRRVVPAGITGDHQFRRRRQGHQRTKRQHGAQRQIA